jgi:hypothetical protein
LIGAESALAVKLGVAADRGQRGAQLVRRVGGELAHLLLGTQPRAERLLNPVEHGVDGRPEPAHLGPVVGIRDPRGEIAPGRDLVGRAGHLVQRLQAAADQPAAPDRQQREQRPPGDQLGHDDPSHLGVHGVHGVRHDEDVPAGRGRRDPGVGQLRGQDHPGHGAQPLVTGKVNGGRAVAEPVTEAGQAHVAQDPGERVGLRARREHHHLPGARGHGLGDVTARVGRELPRVARGRGDQVGVELAAQAVAQDDRGDPAHDQQEGRGDRDQHDQHPRPQRQRAAAAGRRRGPARAVVPPDRGHHPGPACPRSGGRRL